MKKIQFTQGTITKLTEEHYTLILLNGEKVVYKATIDRLEAAGLIDKYNNQKIKLIS
jgi:hypothetical protein